MTRRRHPRPLYRRRRGYTLVIFAMLFFCLMALGALVIDLGLARMTQRQMQTAVDSAALEGLRGDRTTAAEFADLVFGENADLAAHAESNPRWLALDAATANPQIDSGFVNLAESVFFDPVGGMNYPRLQTNDGNDPDGDMIGDGDLKVFQVQMRRTGEGFIPGIKSTGPRIPFLFGQGSLLAPSIKQAGIAVRASSVSQWQRAKSIGMMNNSQSLPGSLQIVVQLSAWQSLFPINSGTQAIVKANGQVTVGSNAVGFVVDAANPTNVWTSLGGAVTPATTVDPASVLAPAPVNGSLGMYVSILAASSVTPGSDISNHIIGFGNAQISVTSAINGEFVLTRLASTLASTNASAIVTKPLGNEFSDSPNDPDLVELMRQHNSLDPSSSSLLFAPALVFSQDITSTP